MAPSTNVDSPSSWRTMAPSTVLDCITMYLTPSPIRDSDKYGPLKAKALQLAALGGATVSSELTDLINVIVVLRVPVTASKVASIKSAAENGTIVTTLEWLEETIRQQKLISTGDYPATMDEQNITEGPPSQSQVVTSTTFQGMRVSVGALAVRNALGAQEVSGQLWAGRAKLLSHDASGKTVIGVATHVVCAGDVRARERELIDAARRANPHVACVTAFWVESCVAAGKLLDLHACALFSPISYETPLRDMTAKRVCITVSGFQRSGEPDWNQRRTVLRRLAVQLGAQYSERLRRRSTTHVIADGRVAASDKVVKAREWGVIVVGHEWLIACARAGKVVGADGFDVEVFRAPHTPRTRRTEAKCEDEEGLATREAAAINLFQRFTDGLNKAGGGNDDSAEAGSADEGVRHVRRSRSVSREAVPEPEREREWSLDASQSQLIVHRDLTPPTTPHKAPRRRTMPGRAAKRVRDQ